jgi:hypothetical protein
MVSSAARFVRSQNALTVSKLQSAPSVTSNSATIANFPSSVESVTRIFVMIAIAIGYLAIDATRRFVLTAKMCSSVAVATRHSVLLGQASLRQLQTFCNDCRMCPPDPDGANNYSLCCARMIESTKGGYFQCSQGICSEQDPQYEVNRSHSGETYRPGTLL